MPPLDPSDVYAADRPGMLSPAVRGFRPLIYVPDSRGASVDVIDPRTHKIVRHFKVPRMPQHVTPAYDLRTLWVASDEGNTLTPIDPRTGAPGRPLTVADPYNLYFTPDGRFAIVVAERLRRLDFRDPHTMKLRRSLPVPCNGVDHMDFSADGRYSMVSCEYSGELLKVDIASQRLLGVMALRAGSMPQDVKLAPDGQVFYVADQAVNGVWLVRGGALGEPARRVGFVATGKGAHGLYTSRDSRYLYVSNRGEGSATVLSVASRKVVATWRLPGGGSPDMGGSPPTDGCCGSRAATTPRSTPSTPAAAGCLPASPQEPGPLRGPPWRRENRVIPSQASLFSVQEYEQVVGRVAAVDVAKASGMVCTRVPHPGLPSSGHQHHCSPEHAQVTAALTPPLTATPATWRS